MLTIVLFSTFSDMLCMVSLASSTWKNVKESPYTPYALSPAAGYLGHKAAKLTCKAGFGILNQFDKQLHPGIYIPLVVGIVGTGIAAATLPSFALTEMIRKQRSDYLLADNLSPWQLYYPGIIQGLTLGLPFAYYLAQKENRFPSIVATTLLSCGAASPGFIAGYISSGKEQQKKQRREAEQLRRANERQEQRRCEKQEKEQLEEEQRRLEIERPKQRRREEQVRQQLEEARRLQALWEEQQRQYRKNEERKQREREEQLAEARRLLEIERQREREAEQLRQEQVRIRQEEQREFLEWLRQEVERIGQQRRQEEERDKRIREIGREAIEQQILSRREEERLNRERLQKEIERHNEQLQEETEHHNRLTQDWDVRTEDLGNN